MALFIDRHLELNKFFATKFNLVVNSKAHSAFYSDEINSRLNSIKDEDKLLLYREFYSTRMFLTVKEICYCMDSFIDLLGKDRQKIESIEKRLLEVCFSIQASNLNYFLNTSDLLNITNLNSELTPNQFSRRRYKFSVRTIVKRLGYYSDALDDRSFRVLDYICNTKLVSTSKEIQLQGTNEYSYSLFQWDVESIRFILDVINSSNFKILSFKPRYKTVEEKLIEVYKEKGSSNIYHQIRLAQGFLDYIEYQNHGKIGGVTKYLDNIYFTEVLKTLYKKYLQINYPV